MELDEIKVGMPVTYVPKHAHGSASHHDCERGVVTSKNDTYAFVRYGANATSQATSPEDLIGG